MNKSELIDSMVEHSRENKSNGEQGEPRLDKAQATVALNAFIDAVSAAMSNNDTVSLVGFGTFSVKERQARTGRNPKTGESMQIPASRVPSFKAGKGLKDGVNGVTKDAKK